MQRMLKPVTFILASGTVLISALDSPAQFIVRHGDEEGEIRRRTLFVPYVFSSETTGFGVGIGGSYAPTSQPQTTYYGTYYTTENGSWLGLLGGHNVKVPHLDRLYLRPYTLLTHQTQMRLYIGNNNPADPGERAGSNESDKDNYQEENVRDASLNLEMRYILPWGHFRNTAVHTYVTRNGILAENPSGGESWNPLESGQSTISFRPHYRKIFSDLEELETLYMELAVEHDNRDYNPNPHRGYTWKAGIQHDFNWLSNTRRWTSLEGSADGFLPMWDASWSRQQTLALSWWSSYSPSYDPDQPDNEGKPPFFTGPTLGGLWRLRGYPSNRFHDKAAVHYAAEYRIMPEWQPLGDIDLLDPLMIRWWQAVFLVEVGRVAPSWDFGELHTDMKYDVGVGLRGMFDQGIGRLDLVVSEEGFSVVAMLGQTF
jgi:hypothetical protein